MPVGRKRLFPSLAAVFMALTTLATIPASADTLNLVSAPDPFRLPAAEPGETSSASFLVHVSNASRTLSLANASATSLQDSNGHVIPSSSITVSPLSLTVPPPDVFSVKVTVSIPGDTAAGNYSGQVLLVSGNGSVTTANLRLTVKPPEWYYGISFIVTLAGGFLSWVYSPVLVNDKEDKTSKNPKKLKNKAKDLRKEAGNLEGEARQAKETHKLMEGIDSLTEAAQKLTREAERLEEEAARLEMGGSFQKAAKLENDARKLLEVQKHPGDHDAWEGFEKAFSAQSLTLLAASLVIAGAAFAYLLTSQSDFGVSTIRDFSQALIQGFTAHRVLDGAAPKLTK